MYSSDVHGKEHHKEGCFSENLVKLKLLVNKDEVIELSRISHPDLFRSTCGGMGLTGFIIEAELNVKKLNLLILFLIKLLIIILMKYFHVLKNI